MDNLNEVITDAISDAELPKEEPETETPEVDASPTESPTESPVEASSEEAAPRPGSKVEPPSESEDDEFTKKYGVPPTSASGRENRLPHSRVRKMVEKAEKETAAKLSAEHTKTLTEYQAKVKDYEERLQQVDAFERVMTSDPDRFLQMLATVPAYQPFFQWVQQAAQGFAAGTPGAPGGGQPAQAGDAMPGPNVELPDGSRQYDEKGIQALLEWQHNRTVQAVEGKLSKEYEPIRREWEASQYMAKVAPEVEKKIAAARQWYLFKENEEEIGKLLAQYPEATLEQAYMHIVQPKLAVDKTKIREEVIADLKKRKPTTSVAAGGSVPTPAATGPRTTAQIIQDEINKLKG